MAATRVQVKFNRVGTARTQIQGEMAKRVARAAQDMRADVRAQMGSGSLPIGPDTGALSASIFVQDAQGSDYAQANAQAQSAYENAGSKHREAVQMEVTPAAYSAAHFAERLAQEEPLGQSPNQARAGVATALGYGAWWQFGHHNVFTGRDEGARDWFAGPSEAWARANLAARFAGLLK